MCCFKSTFLSIYCEPSALVDLEWLNIPQKNYEKEAKVWMKKKKKKGKIKS